MQKKLISIKQTLSVLGHEIAEHARELAQAGYSLCLPESALVEPGFFSVAVLGPSGRSSQRRITFTINNSQRSINIAELFPGLPRVKGRRYGLATTMLLLGLEDRYLGYQVQLHSPNPQAYGIFLKLAAYEGFTISHYPLAAEEAVTYIDALPRIWSNMTLAEQQDCYSIFIRKV